MERKITVVGGDMRQITVGECFAKDGYDVSVYGFDEEFIPPSLHSEKNLADALSGSKTVILGIVPCSDAMLISTPFWKDSLSADALLRNLSKGCRIIGGKISPFFKNLCEDVGITCIDYASREDFAIANAVPSAEGALLIAMQELPVTIHGLDCIVTGFGRIGKILARALHLLGANVTCTARKSSDIAWINSLGYNSAYTDNLIDFICNATVIFNTVPKPIFSRNILTNLTPGTTIIDLASNPGGVDFDCAEELGIKVIRALSLPGKTSPVTAGKIIKNTIANILSEL